MTAPMLASARARSRARRLGLALAVFVVLGPPPVASADDVAGSLAGQLLLADGDVGGGALLDVWAPLEWFRVGGFLGIGVIPSERDDARNRVMMPAGVSIAGRWDGGGVAFSLRARGGLWGGATQATKLTVGGFVGGGLTLGWQASPEIAVVAGIEVWGIFGAGETWCIPFSLGIEWGPGPREAPLAADPDADGDAG